MTDDVKILNASMQTPASAILSDIADFEETLDRTLAASADMTKVEMAKPDVAVAMGHLAQHNNIVLEDLIKQLHSAGDNAMKAVQMGFEAVERGAPQDFMFRVRDAAMNRLLTEYQVTARILYRNLAMPMCMAVPAGRAVVKAQAAIIGLMASRTLPMVAGVMPTPTAVLEQLNAIIGLLRGAMGIISEHGIADAEADRVAALCAELEDETSALLEKLAGGPGANDNRDPEEIVSLH